ncbi:hypothetical protein BKA69DRAFT_94807 [Paraphysoderma sedebokerense]|nr:hypothetical protein BKA69DRAFT_94807 [Paraphysoderma sedebokerense]
MGKHNFLPFLESLSAKNVAQEEKGLPIKKLIAQKAHQLIAPKQSKDKATRDSGIETPSGSIRTEDPPHSENTTEEEEASIPKTEQPGQWNKENFQTIGHLGSGTTANSSRALDMTTGKQVDTNH